MKTGLTIQAKPEGFATRKPPVCVAIIPARGGSKGLPRKNIKKLLGKPLIAYTIEAAKKAKSLDRIFVSTEDKEIAKIAKKYGAEVIERPVELAADDTPTYKVLQHAVKEIENADIVVTLQPTSPIRDAKDIDKAIEILKDSDSVVGVCEIEYHPYWTKKIENGFLVPFVQSDKEYFRRQDMPKAYRINGAIYVTKKHVLMHENSVFGKKASPLVMDELHSIDIDTELDFLAAEAALKKIKGKKK